LEKPVFRSFFPVPRLFFSSAIIWVLVLMALWFTVGGSIRNVISIDRFIVPPYCATTPTAPSAGPKATPATPAPSPSAAPSATPQGAPPSAASTAPAPGGTLATATAAVNAQGATPGANCIPPDDHRFLTGQKVWEYEYVFLGAVLFCLFWFFYRRNEWYWWSVGVSTGLLLSMYYNVQITAWVNNWYNTFYDLIQLSLSGPNKVSLEQYYTSLASALYIVIIYIIVQAFIAFVTSHFVFRWRKAMNFYYMSFWPAIRSYEGAAQRVQEDTQQFAGIVEGLGTTFVTSLMSLIVFVPLLWTLSSHITAVPVIGQIPASLVWIALGWSAFGTVIFAGAGIRLPGLNFKNQRVEAAYRKELVYGEDDAERADPPTIRQLFANLQKNYFRLYANYLYFNLVRFAYLQVDNFFILIVLGPTITAAAITFGLFNQISDAFGRVTGSFQFLANSWTTVVELQSVFKRLRDFESHIPADHEIETEPPLPAPEAGF
jgi:peptide/bleomycin uptake transporter